MPIADFGINLLKSMGWHETRGIGKNPQNVPVKLIQYVPNYERAGLGARKDASLKKRRKLNDIPKPQIDENGKVKNYVEIGVENKRKSKKIERNSKIIIVNGKYEGLTGVVVEINEANKQCFVELASNEKLVKVDLRDVKLYEKSNSKLEKEHQRYINFEKDDKNGSASMEDTSEKETNESDTSSQRKEKRERRKLQWVLPDIKLKIINKKLKNGKFYEKKVCVSDILDQYTFNAIDEKGNLVENLTEKDVETVMPKLTEVVTVLTGEHRGKLGRLIERDRKNNKVLVQLLDSLDIIHLTQDDCSHSVEKI